MFGSLFVLAVFTCIEIAITARNTTLHNADAAVVLGAAVIDNQPSPVFEARIQHAVNLYKAGRVKLIIMTGGIGEGDTISEAEVARQWSIQHGVDKKAIFVETTSRTTYENILYAHNILKERAVKDVLIVSDPLHLPRALAIARHLGISALPSPTPSSRYQGWRVRAWFLFAETYYLMRCRLAGKC